MAAYGYEILSKRNDKPSEPYAFTRSFDPHQVHAVVPVAASHQGQPVGAKTDALDSLFAMLVYASLKLGLLWQEHHFTLVFGQSGTFYVMCALFQDGIIPGGLDIHRCGIRQPEQVVGYPCPD